MAIKKRISLTGQPFNGDNALVIDGVAFDIGTRVIKWWEAEGFSQYGTKRVVVKTEDMDTGKVKTRTIQGKRYKKRKRGIFGVSQILIHHSGADRESPKIMHDVLHNQRGLSVQFAHEDDGRIYQFLDAVEAAKHAGSHNQISIGTECCLYPLAAKRPNYYSAANRKRTGNLPHKKKVEILQGSKMKVFCFPDAQVEAVARWAAGLWFALCYLRNKDRLNEIGPADELETMFCDAPRFPRNAKKEIPKKIIKNAKEHIGLIGHLHCSPRKIDPAGFPWNFAEQATHDYFWEFSKNYSERRRVI